MTRFITSGPRALAESLAWGNERDGTGISYTVASDIGSDYYHAANADCGGSWQVLS